MFQLILCIFDKNVNNFFCDIFTRFTYESFNVIDSTIKYKNYLKWKNKKKRKYSCNLNSEYKHCSIPMIDWLI